MYNFSCQSKFDSVPLKSMFLSNRRKFLGISKRNKMWFLCCYKLKTTKLSWCSPFKPQRWWWWWLFCFVFSFSWNQCLTRVYNYFYLSYLGFLYMDVHDTSLITEVQYLAPLMAYFNPSLSANSTVLTLDDGELVYSVCLRM